MSFLIFAPPSAGAAIFTAQSASGLPDLYDSHAAFYDFNGDGFLDVAIQGRMNNSTVGRTAIYRYSPGASGYVLQQELDPLSEGNVSWGDFDNDGSVDLLVIGANGTAAPETILYQNAGSQNGYYFSPIHNDHTTLPGSLGRAYPADFNRDGLLDILIVGGTAAGARFTGVYINGGEACFTRVAASNLTAIGNEPAAAVADFNRDGFPDVALSGRESATSSIIRVFQGNGNGAFTGRWTLAAGLWDGALAAGDFDGNGKPDFAAIGKTQAGASRTYLFRNDNANNNFAFTQIPTAQAGLDNAYTTSLQFGDFNNDGKADLILAGFNTQTNARVSRLYANQGAAANPIFKEVDAGSTLKADRGFAIFGDYNLDGTLDLIMGGKTVNSNPPVAKVTLYKNTGTDFKAAPTKPSNLTVYGSYDDVNPGAAKITWTGSTAGATPSNSLTYNVEAISLTYGPRIVLAPDAYVPSGLRKVPAPGNAGPVKSLLISGVFPNEQLHSGVQAIDANLQGSPFATGDWTVGFNQAIKRENFTGTVDFGATGANYLDWVHFGRSINQTQFDAKNTATPYFRSMGPTGSPDFHLFSNPDMAFSWNGGKSPNTTGSVVKTGLASGNNLQLSFKSEVAYRIIEFYVGGFDGEAEFSVSDPDFSSGANWIRDNVSFPGKKGNFKYTLTTRNVGGAHQVLYVNWSLKNTPYFSYPAHYLYIMAVGVK
ncbi:MAG TPA: VCBS repeat-containing protein [Fibrobacteria bacterium]|nr:VCBS repeat-containing protein [Fibrobacteria bacterium]